MSDWSEACDPVPARREGITHFEYLQARKARVVRAALKGGMSAAALERLPKPIVPKVEKLPPVVLATRAHATNFRQQAVSRCVTRARVLGTFATPEQEQAILASPFYRIQATGDGAAHLKEMAAVAGSALGLSLQDLARQRSSERFTYGRYVVALVLTELCMITSERLAEALGIGFETAKNARRRGRNLLARSPAYTEKYGVVLQAVYARWPQYRSAA